MNQQIKTIKIATLAPKLQLISQNYTYDKRDIWFHVKNNRTGSIEKHSLESLYFDEKTLAKFPISDVKRIVAAAMQKHLRDTQRAILAVNQKRKRSSEGAEPFPLFMKPKQYH